MPGRQQLSRGGALVTGAALLGAGAMPILIGLGVVHPDGVRAPAWVVLAAGLTFVCGGLAVVLDYAIAGGMAPDGDLPPGTPFAIRAANLALGLAIIGLLGAVSGWIAFGPGPREFSTTVSLLFWSSNTQSRELSGRVAFGIGTVLIAVMFVACGVAGVRRLRQARRS